MAAHNDGDPQTSGDPAEPLPDERQGPLPYVYCNVYAASAVGRKDPLPGLPAPIVQSDVCCHLASEQKHGLHVLGQQI